MVTDVWTERDLPLLEVIAEHDVDHGPVQDTKRLAKLVGDEDSDRLMRSLQRLHEGEMIQASTTKLMGGEQLFHLIRPTSAGRRAVGQWPSHDVAAALLQSIEERIATAATPEERTRWERVRDDIKALGISAMASLLVEAGKHAGGL